MKRNCLILVTLFLFLMGCQKTMGMFPHSTGTGVDLSKSNYRITKLNAIGESTGRKLLCVIPMESPTYAAAMEDLLSKSGISVGKSSALINVTQETSDNCQILYSTPKLTIRADVIEFIPYFEERPVSSKK